MIQPELQKLIDSAEESVHNLLTKYANSTNQSTVKKSKLISYWLRDYMRMIKKEETFDSTKLKRYKRGDVIQAHLGYNIGSEEGGLHYAIVINIFNSTASDVITIIPLTSKKKHYKPRQYDVDLGSTIYKQLKNKYDTLEQELKNRQNEVNNEISNISKRRLKLETDNIQDLQADNFRSILLELTPLLLETRTLSNNLATVKKIKTEINHMKNSSIALIGQITTISKIRIYNPLSKADSLSGIRISATDLDKIDSKIKELYTHQ